MTVALERNVGFGAGCNRGLEAVGEPVMAFLNPDVELLDASLLELAEQALDRTQPERLLAPLVLYPDGSRQDTVHPPPGSRRRRWRARWCRPRLAPGTRSGALAAPASRARSGGRSGCALVARTDTLRRLGPFDDRIFMYGEDLDLGLRAAQAGVHDLVLAFGAGAPSIARTPRARRSGASRSSGSHGPGARSSPAAWARRARGLTTRHR